MHEIIPPLCFLLALALLVVGFSLLVIGFPEASVALHRARASGDDAFTETLEADLHKRRFTRGTLITLSFVGSVVVTVAGFRAMQNR
jgi:hypothetical protein